MFDNSETKPFSKKLKTFCFTQFSDYCYVCSWHTANAISPFTSYIRAATET